MNQLVNSGANSIWEYALVDPTLNKQCKRKPNPRDQLQYVLPLYIPTTTQVHYSCNSVVHTYLVLYYIRIVIVQTVVVVCNSSVCRHTNYVAVIILFISTSLRLDLQLDNTLY